MSCEVSVIIPVFNSQNTIGKCLDTILNPKTSFSYEVIVVDDGSYDSTPVILEQYREKIIIIKQTNAGPAAARNNGAKVANGKILVFTDSDCYFEENFLQEITDPIRNDMRNEIVGVQGRYKTHQKSITARFCQQEIEERYRIYRKVHYISMIGTYAAAYKKDVFFKMGGFDTRFPIASGEDAALSLKMVNHGYKLVFQDSAICYHHHPDTIKKYFRQKYGRAYWRNLLYRMYPGKMVNDSYTPQLLKLQVILTILLYLQLMGYIIVGTIQSPIILYKLTLTTLVLYLLSLLPLIKQTLWGDSKIVYFVPIFSIVRSMALANGLLMGFFRMTRKESNWTG